MRKAKVKISKASPRSKRLPRPPAGYAYAVNADGKYIVNATNSHILIKVDSHG